MAKMYYFEGRNTPVIAESAAAARAKCKRGCGKLVKTLTPSASDRKKMAKGTWVTTRSDGKSKAKSSVGKGRGKGPKRS